MAILPNATARPSAAAAAHGFLGLLATAGRWERFAHPIRVYYGLKLTAPIDLVALFKRAFLRTNIPWSTTTHTLEIAGTRLAVRDACRFPRPRCRL